MSDYAQLEQRLRGSAASCGAVIAQGNYFYGMAGHVEMMVEAADALASLTRELKEAPNAALIGNYLLQLDQRIASIFDSEGRDALLRGLMRPADFAAEYNLSRATDGQEDTPNV